MNSGLLERPLLVRPVASPGFAFGSAPAWSPALPKGRYAALSSRMPVAAAWAARSSKPTAQTGH